MDAEDIDLGRIIEALRKSSKRKVSISPQRRKLDS
jgi:hypothetical protein